MIGNFSMFKYLSSIVGIICGIPFMIAGLIVNFPYTWADGNEAWFSFQQALYFRNLQCCAFTGLGFLSLMLGTMGFVQCRKDMYPDEADDLSKAAIRFLTTFVIISLCTCIYEMSAMNTFNVNYVKIDDYSVEHIANKPSLRTVKFESEGTPFKLIVDKKIADEPTLYLAYFRSTGKLFGVVASKE